MRQLGKVFVHSYPQWLDSITDSMDMNLSKLQETVKHGELSMLQPMGLQRVGQQLNNSNWTEQQATEQQLPKPILFADCWKPYGGSCKANPQLSAPCKNKLGKVMWRVPSYTWAVKAFLGLPGGTMVKNLPANPGDAGDLGSIPGLGRCPGGGNGNWLQHSCLGNPTDRGAWQAIVHSVSKSQTWLSTPTSFLRCQDITPGSTCFPQNSMDRESALHWPLRIWNNVDRWTRCLGKGEVLGWLSGPSIWVTSYQPWKEVFYYARWEETRSRSFFSILTPWSERN